MQQGGVVWTDRPRTAVVDIKYSGGVGDICRLRDDKIYVWLGAKSQLRESWLGTAMDRAFAGCYHDQDAHECEEDMKSDAHIYSGVMMTDKDERYRLNTPCDEEVGRPQVQSG